MKKRQSRVLFSHGYTVTSKKAKHLDFLSNATNIRSIGHFGRNQSHSKAKKISHNHLRIASISSVKGLLKILEKKSSCSTRFVHHCIHTLYIIYMPIYVYIYDEKGSREYIYFYIHLPNVYINISENGRAFFFHTPL